MDPNAALAAGNFDDLANWLKSGGFQPDWSKHPKQTARYRKYIARHKFRTHLGICYTYVDGTKRYSFQLLGCDGLAYGILDYTNNTITRQLVCEAVSEAELDKFIKFTDILTKSP